MIDLLVYLVVVRSLFREAVVKKRMVFKTIKAVIISEGWIEWLYG